MIEYIHMVVVVHLLPVLVCSATPSHRDVVTTQGTVRGYYAPRPPHYAYLGLPYARPPTGHDRFKAPKPPKPWTGIFEAIHQVKCPQPDGTGEENCLVLNVFAPADAASSPVVVHFHDGGYQRGWGAYKGPERLLDQGFVIATFNYRLGILGFLCLDLEEVPGNAGLKDQVAALYWIQRNIARFGGNASDVTAYGTGAGAASTEMLLLSGLTKDLIHKVIIESGSALSPSSITHDPHADALHLAYALGYTGIDDSKYLKAFYNELPVRKLTNITRKLLPCVEKTYYSTHSLINTDPRDIIKSGNYHHVPTLIVFTNAEQVALISENIDWFKTVPDTFVDILPSDLAYNSEQMKYKISELVKHFYFNELELKESIIQSYVDYVNDIFLEYPLVKSASYHSKKTSVFLMKFLYRGKLSKNINEKIHGAAHGDVFRYITSSKNLDGYDAVVVETIVTLWSNFIKLGDPTPLTTKFFSEIWQPVVPHMSDGNVILHNINCFILGKSLRNEQLPGQQFLFWDHIYEKFYINSVEQKKNILS